MDLNVRMMFDEVLKRIHDLGASSNQRWELWEKRFNDATDDLKERNTVVETRIASLEEFASAQYFATVVADNWGSHFDSRVSDLERRMVDLEGIRVLEIADERDECVAVLESFAAEFCEWRPCVDGQLDDLRYELKRSINFGNRDLEGSNYYHQGILAQPAPVAVRPFAGTTTNWPNGHRVASSTWTWNYGSVMTIVPDLANGTYEAPLPHPPPALNPRFSSAPHNPPPPPRLHPPQTKISHLGQLPKVLFPKFDGSTPQLWITQAQSYFEMYFVDPVMWVRVATMQFTGATNRWLQLVAHRVQHADWTTLCALVRERFSHDQHELLLRQLFHIKQTSSVQEYVDKFVDLIE